MTEQAKRRRKGGSDGSEDDESDELVEKDRDFAFTVVTQSRKKASEDFKSADAAVGELEGGPRGVSGRAVDVGVDAQQIKTWGTAREYPGFVKILNIESLFHELKTSRQRKPRSTILLLLRQWSHNFSVDEKFVQSVEEHDMASQAPLLPVVAKLRVISGSKVIFFDEYKGALPATTPDTSLIARTTNLALTEIGIGTAIVKGVADGVRRHDGVGEALDSSIRETVIHLWIRGQSDREMLKDLAAILKHNKVAVIQLSELWTLGSEEAKRELREYLSESGVDLNFDRLAEEHVIMPLLPSPKLRPKFRRKKQEQVAQGLADQAGPMALSLVAVHPVKLDPAIVALVNFKGFGISLIDQIPNEFLYISLAQLIIELELKPEEINLRSTLGWLQIDNPSDDAYYPTVLRPIHDSNSFGTSTIDMIVHRCFIMT